MGSAHCAITRFDSIIVKNILLGKNKIKINESFAIDLINNKLKIPLERVF
jgi:hypothetical protein